VSLRSETLVIEAGRTERHYWRDLWRYRELFLLLTWRDILVRYKILDLLQRQPQLSQRALARELGLSLGKVNYCVQALIEKGLVKAQNFRNHQNKTAYMYYLTPRGIEHKARVTVRFLKAKLSEYEQLKAEIEALRRDAERERARQR